MPRVREQASTPAFGHDGTHNPKVKGFETNRPGAFAAATNHLPYLVYVLSCFMEGLRRWHHRSDHWMRLKMRCVDSFNRLGAYRTFHGFHVVSCLSVNYSDMGNAAKVSMFSLPTNSALIFGTFSQHPSPQHHIFNLHTTFHLIFSHHTTQLYSESHIHQHITLRIIGLLETRYATYLSTLHLNILRWNSDLRWNASKSWQDQRRFG